jgi:hypothetical protein
VISQVVPAAEFDRSVDDPATPPHQGHAQL